VDEWEEVLSDAPDAGTDGDALMHAGNSGDDMSDDTDHFEWSKED